MNKLVSKNPVLRFKLGKKIGKFENPSGPIKFTKTDLRTARSEVNPRFKARGSRIPKTLITPKSSSGFSLFNKVGKIGRVVNKIGKISPYAIVGSIIGDKISSTIWNHQKELKQKTAYLNMIKQEANSWREKAKLQKINNFWNKLSEQGLNDPDNPFYNKKYITPIDNYYVKGYGEGLLDEIAKLGGVRAVLNKLIKLGLLNDRFGADGKWGKNTQAAYEAYKKIAFNPQTIPAAELIEKTPDYVDSPINNSQVDLAGIAKQYLYAKQGGLLPSRNPVLRFKSNFR